MLARVLAMARCLRMSVTSRCSIEMDGRIELVFNMEAFIMTKLIARVNPVHLMNVD